MYMYACDIYFLSHSDTLTNLLHREKIASYLCQGSRLYKLDVTAAGGYYIFASLIKLPQDADLGNLKCKMSRKEKLDI